MKEKIIWEWTPVEDKEFDEEKRKILGLSKEKFRLLCSKLTIEDVIILNSENKQKILNLKKKYGISSRG